MDVLQVVVQGRGAPALPALYLHAGVVSPPRVHERELAALVPDRAHVIGVTPAGRISRGRGLGSCKVQEWFRD